MNNAKYRKKIFIVASLLWGPLLGVKGAELRVDFEDVARGTPPMEAYTGTGGGYYYNGSDGAGGFTSHGVEFGNQYMVDWGSWSGWAYSTTTDTETPGYGNQYSAYPGTAADGEVFAVTYAPSEVHLPVGWKAPLSIQVANTTYAAVSMKNGDDFAKKFGDDPSTTETVETGFPDFFKVTLTGYDAGGTATGTVEVYLADYRGEDASDFILDTWKTVDLSVLGEGVATLSFSLESSDVGSWGINTPSAIAVDNLVLAPTATWDGYDVDVSGWVDTGAFLGFIYPVQTYAYVLVLGKWVYIPEEGMGSRGSWVYLSK